MDLQALHVIETLRSGVPCRHVAALLSAGREALVARILADAEAVAAQGATGGCFIQADYGNGKTHLLAQLQNMAEEKGFVVSLVPLSKETPFNDPRKVYRQLAASIQVPRTVLPGISDLLERIPEKSRKADDLVGYAEEHLHGKLAALLESYFHAQSQPEHRHLLLTDLQGEPVPMPQLKAIYRLLFGSALKVERFTKEHVLDYVDLLRRLFQIEGYRGWLVLFDEAELVGKLGAKSRAEAYYRMGQFLGLDARLSTDGDAVCGLYTVFSLASGFSSDVLDGKLDLDEAPERLPLALPREGSQVVRDTLTRIRDAYPLAPIDDASLRALMRSIVEMHTRAYAWPRAPRFDVDGAMERYRAERLRTRLRVVVQSLDLEYQYGELPAVSTRRLAEPDLVEDEADGTGAPPFSEAGPPNLD